MTIKRLLKSKFLFCSLCLLSAALFLNAAAEAKQIYMYRDSRGVIHFTDAPTDERYQPFTIKAKIKVGRFKSRMDHELLKPYIYAAGKLYNLDPALITAVIRVESAFDPNAVSWAGAQGLMQLMPGTAARMGVDNVFSARQNIFGGSRYLRQMLNRFGGDLSLSLAAYNCGPGRVEKANKIPNIKETQAYVKQVLTYYAYYKKKL